MKGRWHDTRHTVVTQLGESGASPTTIMATVGHVSRWMLERYSHPNIDAQRRAMEQMVAAISHITTAWLLELMLTFLTGETPCHFYRAPTRARPGRFPGLQFCNRSLQNCRDTVTTIPRSSLAALVLSSATMPLPECGGRQNRVLGCEREQVFVAGDQIVGLRCQQRA